MKKSNLPKPPFKKYVLTEHGHIIKAYFDDEMTEPREIWDGNEIHQEGFFIAWDEYMFNEHPTTEDEIGEVVAQMRMSDRVIATADSYQELEKKWNKIIDARINGEMRSEEILESLINANGQLNWWEQQRRENGGELDKLLNTQDRLCWSVNAKEIDILFKVFRSQCKRLKKELEVNEILKSKKVDLDYFTDLFNEPNGNDEQFLYLYNCIYDKHPDRQLTKEEFIKIKEWLHLNQLKNK